MNKIALSFKTTVSIILLVLVCNSCVKTVEPVLMPELVTTAVSNITEGSAESGGFISSDAGNEITSRGVCWGTNPNPTIADSLTKDAAGTGKFNSKILRLSPNTTYYLRAYAINKNGTAYGLQETFTTRPLGITTTEITEIAIDSAKTGGNIAIPGDSSNITERGVCWNSQPAPTIQNNKTTDGKGTGAFSSTLTGLQTNTTYFVRVYATNSGGTYYGNEISFKTQNGIVGLTTTAVSGIGIFTASSGGIITEESGTSVLARGLCWSTSPNPTVSDNKTNDGNGIGSYSSSLTELSPNTTYYIRAYATNTVGTSYGNELNFKTLSGIVSLTTTTLNNIGETVANSGGSITADGGSAVIARGVCWNTTSNPSISDSKTTNGSGVGIFTSSLTGLSYNTTYYIRAYATNIVGTSYGNELSFKTSATVTDADGNSYTTIKIGTQTWMLENLKTTKYNDGTDIPLVTNNNSWSVLTTPAYCWYNNIATNKNKYGALYNGHAVNSGKLAPEGWHVATEAEWTALENYISVHAGFSINIGPALSATTDWTTSTAVGAIGNNLTKNNSSGFTALPGGYRDIFGFFTAFGTDGSWWTSTQSNSTANSYKNLNYAKYILYKNNINRINGYSVRCIKD